MVRFGVPGQNTDTLAYADGRLSTVPVVQAPRRPTVNDKKYPMWCEWRVNKAAQAPVIEGEFWKLIRFESNGDATWVQLNAAQGGTLDDIRDQVDVQVTPDGNGNIDIDGNTVGNGTNPSGIPLETVADVGTNTLDVNIQVATAVTGAPGDKNDAGIVSLDDSQFTVDTDGYTSLTNPFGPQFGFVNLGFSYSAGTLTIKGADGNDLSASNPAYVTMPSNVTEGKLITTALTANKTFDDSLGASSIFAGSLFGFQSGDVTTNTTNTGFTGVHFFVNTVMDVNDANLTFIVLPRNGTTTAGTSTQLFNPGSGLADSFTSVLAIETITLADYYDLGRMRCGCFLADKTAGDDWTITNVSNTGRNAWNNGIALVSNTPLGAFGTIANSVFFDNGGTAPTINTGMSRARYGEAETSRALEIDYSLLLNSTPSGAVTAMMAGPPKLNKGATQVNFIGFHTRGSIRSIIQFVRPDNSTNFFLYKADGTSAAWTYDDLQSGDIIECTFTYNY